MIKRMYVYIQSLISMLSTNKFNFSFICDVTAESALLCKITSHILQTFAHSRESTDVVIFLVH